MARSRKFLTVGALAVGALSLIGAGAGAAFNDAATATNHLNTGTLSMKISSVDVNNNHVADGLRSAGGKSISFIVVNSGSQINQKHLIRVTNTGSLPLVLSSFSVHPDGNNDSPLNRDVTMRLDEWTGSVDQAQSTAWECVGPRCTIAPGDAYQFRFNLYANLGNTDQDQTIRPTLTIGATEAPPQADNAPGGATHIVPTNG
ncbi:MAG: hypothetical protein ABI903_13295 [Actinomycetota bacterium]